MTHFLSNAIVVAAIALSLAYAVWHLGPQPLRETLRLHLRKYFPRQLATPVVSASGCGGCNGCAAATLARKNSGCGSPAKLN